RRELYDTTRQGLPFEARAGRSPENGSTTTCIAQHGVLPPVQLRLLDRGSLGQPEYRSNSDAPLQTRGSLQEKVPLARVFGLKGNEERFGHLTRPQAVASLLVGGMKGCTDWNRLRARGGCDLYPPIHGVVTLVGRFVELVSGIARRGFVDEIRRAIQRDVGVAIAKRFPDPQLLHRPSRGKRRAVVYSKRRLRRPRFADLRQEEGQCRRHEHSQHTERAIARTRGEQMASELAHGVPSDRSHCYAHDRIIALTAAAIRAASGLYVSSRTGVNGTGTSGDATRAIRALGQRSAMPAASSAPTPPVFGPSSTITTRPVLATEAPIVSQSMGARLRTSITSASIRPS